MKRRKSTKRTRERREQAKIAREKFIKGLRKKSKDAAKKLDKVRRKLAGERKRLIRENFGIEDEDKISALSKRISHRRLLMKDEEPKVRVRFKLRKRDGVWIEKKTKKEWSEANVRRSIAVRAYWNQVKFVARTAGISVSEARSIYSDIFKPGGGFPEIAGS